MTMKWLWLKSGMAQRPKLYIGSAYNSAQPDGKDQLLVNPNTGRQIT